MKRSGYDVDADQQRDFHHASAAISDDMGNRLEIPGIYLLEECMELLDEGKTVLLTAKGSSMHPFIRNGEKILLQKKESYRRGDIVLAMTDSGETVLHRIVSMRDGTVMLMGDNNLQKTETCRATGIKGKVESISGRRGTRLTSSWRHRFLSWIWLSMLPVRKILVKITDTICR